MTAEGIDYLDFDFCQNIEPCAHRKKKPPQKVERLSCNPELTT